MSCVIIIVSMMRGMIKPLRMLKRTSMQIADIMISSQKGGGT